MKEAISVFIALILLGLYEGALFYTDWICKSELTLWLYISLVLLFYATAIVAITRFLTADSKHALPLCSVVFVVVT